MTPAEIRALDAEAIASLHQPVPAFQWRETPVPPLELVELPLRHRCGHLSLLQMWFR